MKNYISFSIIRNTRKIQEGRNSGYREVSTSGLVDTAADEDSADGKVVFDSPILVRGVKRIEGLTLESKHGKLVEYSVRVGAEAFRKHLGSAEGDVDRFGFFAIGLNPRA